MQTRSKGNQDLVQLVTHRRPRTNVQAIVDHIEAMAEIPQQQQQPQQPQRIPNPVGVGDTADANQDRHGIQPPGIQNNNFEIKIGLINMVQANRYHGLPSEDPLDHIDRFNKLLDLLKINGVSEDALKLRLFPFSLGDKAHQWETNLPQGSITTWADCKKAFLNKFFSPVRTAKLRNEISSFKQLYNESFHDAWERFRELKHQCPHHGFSDATLLSTLYRGALPKFRQLLDTASNGSFLAKDVEEAMQLVENLATSDGTYGDDYDRTTRTKTDQEDSKRDNGMKALSEKLDKQQAIMEKQASLFDKLLSSPKSDSYHTVNYVEDCNYDAGITYEQEVVNEEEINYVGNQGYYNPNNLNNPLLSYRSNNVANPQDQTYPPRPNQPNQVLPSNQAQQPRPQANFSRPQGGSQPNSNQPPPGYQRFQPRFGNQQQPRFNQGQQNFGNQGQGYGYNQGTGQQGFPQGQAQNQTPPQPDLITMMQQMLSGQGALHTKVANMEDEIKQLKAQAASSSSRPNQLPGKAEANPRNEYINAIELRSGTTLPTRKNPHLNEDIENKKGGRLC